MKKMTKKKKLFRKVTALAAVIALGASLAGCGSSGEETTQRYSWPLATASPEDTVTQIFAEKFAEEISELSDGRMKIQVYANSTLGGDRDLLETCADGDIPFVVQNTAPQVSFMGDLAVFDLPCVFDSLDECREKIDNPEFYELISNVYTVIASNHDFFKTPAKADIIYRLRKMQDMNADIPKIAVMPQNRKDVLTLLAATEEMATNYADRPIITMSMAGTGVISRLCGEVFGSSMTFGAAKKASAPGQMGVNDLSTVLDLLHKAM